MNEALRLFLIEDDDDIALLIRKSLERAGHQVTRCRNASDALIVVGQDSPDLIILDNGLPDMNGLDLLQTFAIEGILAPVLMVTQNEAAHMATRVLHAGALDYMVKDSNLAFLTELPKRVQESVTRHRLQHMNRLLQEALESARDGILITDLQGTIVHVNQALEAMTGYSRPELLGTNARLLKSSLHPPKIYQELWKTILARSSWQGELTNRRKDGSLIEVSLTVSPIVDALGKMTHFVGIQRDISERKHLERQLLQAQKMQSVGTLAGGVAHEFNNLLAGISGYASLGLREANATQTLRDYLQRIVDLSDRAAKLTRQLLTFARKPALTRQPLSIHNLVQSTAEFVSDSLQLEAVIDFQDQNPDGKCLMVEGDANQLQQALVNLTLNARDALKERKALEERESKGKTSDVSGPISEEKAASSPPASMMYRVRHAIVANDLPTFPQNVPPGDYVLVEVIDQGCGMTTDILSQAIDPFFTTKDVGQGTGLGLPMVFGIVQGHQGHLAITSTPGQGTCVGLYLPCLIGSLPRETLRAPFESGQILEPETSLGRHILVIDDEEAVLDIVRRFLEIAGHQVICASSGHDGLDWLSKSKEIDLVVLDLMMPREDSAITFQRIRQRRPDLPVLLCTGMPQAQPAPDLLKNGRVSIIRKPFRMNELWYAVSQAVAAGA